MLTLDQRHTQSKSLAKDNNHYWIDLDYLKARWTAKTDFVFMNHLWIKSKAVERKDITEDMIRREEEYALQFNW
jgi:hypothetical protein